MAMKSQIFKKLPYEIYEIILQPSFPTDVTDEETKITLFPIQLKIQKVPAVILQFFAAITSVSVNNMVCAFHPPSNVSPTTHFSNVPLKRLIETCCSILALEA